MGDISVSDEDIEATDDCESLKNFWKALIAGDVAQATEIYRDDAVLRVPQTGEKIVGRSAIASRGVLEAGEKPVSVNSITGADNVWVAECEARWHRKKILIVSVAEMDDGQIVAETRYRVPNESTR